MAVAFRNLVRDVGGAIRSSVWYLEGCEPNTRKMLGVVFAGGEQQKEYVASLAFNNDCRQTYAGKLYLPQILHLLHRNERNCALAFIEGHRIHRLLYERRRDFYIPMWLESCADIPLKASTKGAKEDLRRIRKHGLSYKLASDIASVKDFYENMYLPTIHDRHENTALSAGFDRFQDMLGRPDNQLLLIMHGETVIAGVIIQMQEIPRLWVAGIRDSSNDYRRMGVVGATYHFPAEYLAELGYRQMGFGRSRSFLRNGVVLYKNKWNHRYYDFDRDGMIARVLEVSESLSGFLTSQPFISIREGRMHANVFVDAMIPPNDRVLEEIEFLRTDRGVSGVSTYSIDVERGTISESKDG